MHQPVFVWGRHWGPARLILVTFAGAIAVGTVLLSLPAASVGSRLPLSDALFTATSAACVTGLVVVDTGSELSRFGQSVVLCLFQLGGLGIMTFSTLGMVMMGRHLRLVDRVLTASSLGSHESMGDARALLRRVVLVTLAFEACGAAVLALRWWRGGVPDALWGAVFTAVSAFCNAGFALHRDSLAFMRPDWVANFVVMALIVFGGLGFPVILELHGLARRLLRREGRPVSLASLHTKVVVTVSAALVLTGAVVIVLLEGKLSLSGATGPELVLVALFQSVTTRTAGFSTVDIGAFQPATLFVLMLLMFVGGSPGSTAGGVKTTAIGTLGALLWSRTRGSTTVDVFHRTISDSEVRRAVTVIASSITVLLVGVFALLVTEHSMALASGAIDPADQSRGQFLDVAFEAVSALGTVGLSTGFTSEVSLPGRLVLIVLMYVGRVGPLTVAVGMVQRQRRSSFSYPEESVLIG